MAVIGGEGSLGVFFYSDFSVLPLRGGIYDWMRYPRRCHWAGMMDALSGRLRGDGWLVFITEVFLWHLFIDILHFGSFQSAFDDTKDSFYTEK